MPIAERTIKTTHANIAISETSGSGLPVLFLHGNSSCKEAFNGQLEGTLADAYRMIAMDLPGHGASSNAFDPERTYSAPGYAACAVELLKQLDVDRVVVVGWSLGGHAALEMLPLFPGVVGLMIMGTPPVRRDMESIQQGFQPSPALLLAGKEEFTTEDFDAFAKLTLGPLGDPVLIRAMHRADGAARRVMFESLISGRVSDQRELAENASVPVAIVNGADDPLVNLDYIGGLQYRSLWDRHCFVLRGLAHVPFREAPEIFNPILGRFLADMERLAAESPDRAQNSVSFHAA